MAFYVCVSVASGPPAPGHNPVQAKCGRCSDSVWLSPGGFRAAEAECKAVGDELRIVCNACAPLAVIEDAARDDGLRG